MEIGKLIMERKIGAAETTLLSLPQLAINQAMYRLDIELHKSTLKWGVGRLLELAPPDLLAKWSSQMAKLNAAILAGDVPLVEELVVGSCRGVAALERAAVAAGHIPYEPQFWEIAAGDGTIYRVVRHREELQAMPRGLDGPWVCLEELVAVLHARSLEVFKTAPREVGREYVASGKPLDEAIPFDM